MTQEEKDLLLKDLCTRLPYGVKVQFHLPNYNTNCFDDKIGEVFKIGNVFTGVHCDGIDYLPNTDRIKPYLRPMPSMTEAEVLEYVSLKENIIAIDDITYYFETYESIDWLNKNMFDYRGLIEKGLALEAPKGMYNV